MSGALWKFAYVFVFAMDEHAVVATCLRRLRLCVYYERGGWRCDIAAVAGLRPQVGMRVFVYDRGIAPAAAVECLPKQVLQDVLVVPCDHYTQSMLPCACTALRQCFLPQQFFTTSPRSST
jgi:hypothetical protein